MTTAARFDASAERRARPKAAARARSSVSCLARTLRMVASVLALALLWLPGTPPWAAETPLMSMSAHVQWQEQHVHQALDWLEQWHLDPQRRHTVPQVRLMDEGAPNMLDSLILDEFELQHAAERHGVTAAPLPLGATLSDTAADPPALELPAPESQGTSLFQQLTAPQPDGAAFGAWEQSEQQEWEQILGAGASIDALTGASQQAPHVTSAATLYGVRAGTESHAQIERGVSVGMPGALGAQDAIGLTAPTMERADEARTAGPAAGAEGAGGEQAAPLAALNSLYGGIYGPESFRQRYLQARQSAELLAHEQTHADFHELVSTEEERMSSYLHSTMGRMGTLSAVLNYLRTPKVARQPKITQQDIFDHLQAEQPALLARRGGHYFNLTAPDGKTEQGTEIATFAREQGTFIHYSLLYLKARYGERSRGILIKGREQAHDNPTALQERRARLQRE